VTRNDVTFAMRKKSPGGNFRKHFERRVIMGYILFLILGIAIGGLLTHLLYFFSTTTGTILVDHSDPDGDIFGIKIDRDKDFYKKDRVIFTIDHLADISQE
jgi:hypothetical protein